MKLATGCFHFFHRSSGSLGNPGVLGVPESWESRESRSLGSLGSPGVSNCKLYLCRNKDFFIAHPSLYSSWPSVGSLAAPLVGFPPLPPTPKMDSEHFFFMEYVFDNLSSSPTHTLDRHSYMVEVWEMFQ